MKVVFLRPAHKYIQKCDYGLYLRIEKEIQKLSKHPEEGKKLSGTLKDFLVWKFFYKRSEYQIAYRIENDIIVVMIVGRENFYKKLER